MNVNQGIPPNKRFKHPIGVQVHKMLWEDWDPIGVNGWGPDDEYDAYVWPIIGKISQGETVEQIADYLDWATTEHMGLSGEPELVRNSHLVLAAKLVSLRDSNPNE